MSLPGVRGLDHIGFTVPDLDAASGWLVDVLGCEFMYSLGPFSSEGDWMSNHLGVHPRAVMRELRFFRCGGPAVPEAIGRTALDILRGALGHAVRTGLLS